MTTKTAKKSAGFNIEKFYPWMLAVLSLLGFFAAFVLSVEKIELLKNPNYQLSCSINPLLSCGPIITSNQASAFNFPNPYIGLFAFGILLSVAVSMIAGSAVDKKVRWYWKAFIAGHLFGLGFIAWLIHESLYELKSLCMYCMLAWAVTFALNWYGFLWLSITGRIEVRGRLARFRDWGLKNHWGVLLTIYIAVFILIFFAFRSYFESVWF